MKIKCLKCNDIIESLSQHDFKYCKCNACSIDGGTHYTRKILFKRIYTKYPIKAFFSEFKTDILKI